MTNQPLTYAYTRTKQKTGNNYMLLLLLWQIGCLLLVVGHVQSTLCRCDECLDNDFLR